MSVVNEELINEDTNEPTKSESITYFAEKASKYRYSREELMGLRFLNLEYQKKMWLEVYCGLGDSANEYDELLLKHHKDGKVGHNLDLRPRKKSCARGGGSNHIADNSFTDGSDLATFASAGDKNSFSVEVAEDVEEDDDSDDDYSSIQRPAFHITGEPDFDSGPPQDGLEYLRRVRWEAARVPKVVTAAKVKKTKEQTVYMPQIPDIVKCSENLLPHKLWEKSFLADFSELRRVFSQLDPQADIKNSSIKLKSTHKEDILGHIFENVASGKFNSLTLDESCSPEAPCSEEPSEKKVNTYPQNITNLPNLSTIFQMSYAARNSMLKRRVNAVENMSSLPYNDCLWLFALCATVDYPLDSDTSASLRSLLRKCAKLRAGKNEIDGEVVMLNILITVAGRYFRQLEN